MEHTERMGRDPILKLMLSFALPAMTGILAHALYNIVDRLFVGHWVGPAAIAGIIVAFPFMIAISAVGNFIGVGSATLISLALGAGRRGRAERFLGFAMLMLLGAGVLLSLGGWAFLDPLLWISGASPAILPYAQEYTGVIVWGAFFSLTALTCNNLIRSEGAPRFAMMTLVFGALANVVLDTLFIVVWGMGVRGAALATVLSQVLSALWAVSYYFRGRSTLRMRLSKLRPRWSLLRRVAAVGIPPFLMEISFTVLMSVFNHMAGNYGGDMALASVGIFFSIDALLFLPALGVSEGVQPLVGYNYGAGHYRRTITTAHLGTALCTGLFLLSAILVQIFPEAMVTAFTKGDDTLLAMTARAMRLGYVGLPCAGIYMVTVFFLQGLGKATTSMALSLSRQIFIILPLLIFLPRIWGLDGVWLSFAISDVAGGIMATFFYVAECRRLRNMEESSGEEERPSAPEAFAG